MRCTGAGVTSSAPRHGAAPGPECWWRPGTGPVRPIVRFPSRCLPGHDPRPSPRGGAPVITSTGRVPARRRASQREGRCRGTGLSRDSKGRLSISASSAWTATGSGGSSPAHPHRGGPPRTGPTQTAPGPTPTGPTRRAHGCQSTHGRNRRPGQRRAGHGADNRRRCNAERHCGPAHPGPGSNTGHDRAR